MLNQKFSTIYLQKKKDYDVSPYGDTYEINYLTA